MSHADSLRKQMTIYGYIVILINLALMTRWIGFIGLTYFVIALLFVYFFTTIGAVAVCDTIGKQIRLRNSKEQYNNAAALSKNLIIYQLIKGGVLWAIAAALADTFLRDYMQLPYAISIFYILSPVIMLRSLNEGLKGALKGESKDAFLMIAELLHQVAILGLSFLFGYLLKEKGIKVSNLLGKETFSFMYGGIGIAIAVTACEILLTIVYMTACFRELKKKLPKLKGGMRANDVFSNQLMTLFRNRFPNVLCGLLLISPVMFTLYLGLNKADITAETMQSGLGTMFYSFLILAGILICYCVARVVAVYNRSCVAMKKNETRMARSFFRSGVQITAARTIFFTMFLFFMAQNLANIFLKDSAVIGANCLKYCAFLVLPFATCFYFAGICSISGKKMFSVFCLFVSAVIFVCTVLIQRNSTAEFVYTFLLALVIAAYVCTVIFGAIVFGLFKQGIDIIQFIIFPIVSALLVGIVCIVVRKMLTPHIGEPLMLVVSFVVSGGLYWMVLLFLHCFRAQDLEAVPGGKLILAAGQMLHVL